MRHFLWVTLVSAAICLSPVICAAADDVQPDPYENTSILVEAFVVEVQNAALAEAGVNPLGQAPDNVTPVKILWCLKDDDKAQVLSGAKLTARHRNEASTECGDTVYFRRETGAATVRDGKPVPSSNVIYEPYNRRQKFTVRPTVKSDGNVFCGFNYIETQLRPAEDKLMPPGQLSYNWNGGMVVPDGSPVIAAAVQGEQTTTFFILTATVQGGSEEQI